MYTYIRGACGVIVIVIEMDMANRVQILDKAVSISHSTNLLENGINPAVSFPTMGK